MKLALIAISGLRAHNRELTRLGLTLPGFVERNKTIASLPSLGLLTLAGMTPDDVELGYFEVEDLAQFDGIPDDYNAVAISSFSGQIKDAYVLADQFRSAGVRVILGGLHVTARPDEALQHADSVIIGEGEPSWPTSNAENCSVNMIREQRLSTWLMRQCHDTSYSIRHVTTD